MTRKVTPKEYEELLYIVKDIFKKVDGLTKKQCQDNQELMNDIEVIGDIVCDIRDDIKIDLDKEEDEGIIEIDEDYDMP